MKLEILSEEHEEAFLSMLDDYANNDPKALAEFFNLGDKSTPAIFKKYVAAADKARLDWRPSAKAVSLTRYVLKDTSGKIVGNGLMRFPLDEETEQVGGNLDFNEPPAFRGGDHDAFTLNGMLFEAVRAGMARVLVTALETDQKRRSAIERNRGELQDIIEIKKVKAVFKIARYWIRFR